MNSIVPWRSNDLGRGKGVRNDLPYPPWMARHHNDPVRQIYRFRDIVRDEHHRLPVRFPDFKQEILHDRARQRIERAKWLVQEQDGRIDRQHARNGGALPHAAGKLGRHMMAEGAEPHSVDQRIDIRSLLTIAVGGKRRTERHVRTYAQPGKQRALLEDDAAVRPRPNDRLAVQQNLALRWRLKASKKIEQRRFSASARADDRDELTVCNVERHAQKSRHFAGRAVIRLPHVS